MDFQKNSPRGGRRDLDQQQNSYKRPSENTDAQLQMCGNYHDNNNGADLDIPPL
jgi:hypothetical protein